MIELESLVQDLRSVGLSDGEIEKVVATSRKMNPDSPEKLYYLMNLANVTNMKTIARALIAVYGEEGHQFIKQKVKETSISTTANGNRKNWEGAGDEINLKRHLGEMVEAAKMRMILSAIGDNSNGNGNNNSSQNYPMIEEPFLKDGRFVIDDDGKIVTKKIPMMSPQQQGGGMNEMMMMMFMKMFENMTNSNRNSDETLMKLFEVVASKTLNDGGSDVNKLYEQMATMKEKLTEKELEMRDREMQGILRDFAEEIGNLKRSQGKGPLDEIVEVKNMLDTLGELGFAGPAKTKEDYDREWGRKEREREWEMQDKSLNTIKDVVSTIGQPIAGAIGAGLRESMLRRGTEPTPEEVSDMISEVKTQKVMGGGRMSDTPLDMDDFGDSIEDMQKSISMAKSRLPQQEDDFIEVNG